MEQLWPTPSPAAADVIRSVCQRMLADADALADALTPPTLTAQRDPGLLSDPALTAEDREVNREDLVQWLTANIQKPGQRVDPYFGSRTSAYFRDLASRGIAPDFVGGWRAALAVGWRRWLEECLSVCSDPEVLVEILDITAQCMVQYAIDWFAAADEARFGDAIGAADAEAMATIQLIAGGTTVPQEFAENRLGYRLARWHQALVLWIDDPEHIGTLEEQVAAVRSASGTRNTLIAHASTTARWLWVSGPAVPDLRATERALLEAQHVRSALGRPGQGIDGFRSSHQDALAAQRMVVRLGSPRRLTAYADVELIDTLTRDRASAQRFVTHTLGPLAMADPTLREALLTFVQSGFNTTRAAATLYAHRNTVERRVSRANELSLVKVEDNPTHVAAALLVLDIAPDLVTRDPQP
jgi:DNA-binding PucR family transcriptional regulator